MGLRVNAEPIALGGSIGASGWFGCEVMSGVVAQVDPDGPVELLDITYFFEISDAKTGLCPINVTTQGEIKVWDGHDVYFKGFTGDGKVFVENGVKATVTLNYTLNGTPKTMVEEYIRYIEHPCYEIGPLSAYDESRVYPQENKLVAGNTYTFSYAHNNLEEVHYNVKADGVTIASHVGRTYAGESTKITATIPIGCKKLNFSGSVTNRRYPETGLFVNKTYDVETEVSIENYNHTWMNFPSGDRLHIFTGKIVATPNDEFNTVHGRVAVLKDNVYEFFECSGDKNSDGNFTMYGYVTKDYIDHNSIFTISATVDNVTGKIVFFDTYAIQGETAQQ